MTYRLIASFLAPVVSTVVVGTPAAAASAQPTPSKQECRLETPAQVGPRAPLRAAVRVCAPEAEPEGGHYELYWPHWLSQRALPPVRRWVPDRT